MDGDEGLVPQWVQCMRLGWFPATTNIPSTAFTFDFLDFFQELTFQGKTNLYDFWKALERFTDNSGEPVFVSRPLQFPGKQLKMY